MKKNIMFGGERRGHGEASGASDGQAGDVHDGADRLTNSLVTSADNDQTTSAKFTQLRNRASRTTAWRPMPLADHLRNHAMIAWEAEDWRLSALHDVVPTVAPWQRARSLALTTRSSRPALKTGPRPARAKTGPAHRTPTGD